MGAIIDKAVAWAISIANDNSHGYSQQNRWGPDYDCSSLVIAAFEQAGLKVKSAGASYTGNMKPVFLSKGFRDVTTSVNRATGAGLQKGDVLLNIVNHTALYIGNGRVVHARSSEGNSIPGDASGNEIRVQPYFNYPWDCVLRYVESGSSSSSSATPVATPSVSTPVQTSKTETCKAELPEINYGDKGEAVRAMQTLLILRGKSCGVYGADGDYGTGTQSALKMFQASKGLAADGCCGEKTWAALING